MKTLLNKSQAEFLNGARKFSTKSQNTGYTIFRDSIDRNLWHFTAQIVISAQWAACIFFYRWFIADIRKHKNSNNLLCANIHWYILKFKSISLSDRQWRRMIRLFEEKSKTRASNQIFRPFDKKISLNCLSCFNFFFSLSFFFVKKATALC